MKPIQVLWVDDEINLLKPHIQFLEEKGYTVSPCTNGPDALELIKTKVFDIVLLDENMPGMDGLEVLSSIKQAFPNLAVIMITKSETETLMEEAIGAKISDYLIKPVNPNQILLSLKKNLDHSRLVMEKTTIDYQRSFQELTQEIGMANNLNDWVKIYQKLCFWELELESLESNDLQEILSYQKGEANSQFSRFVCKNYESLLKNDDSLVFSHQMIQKLVLPKLASNSPTLLVVVDNLRYDQWRVLQGFLTPFYSMQEETICSSILPTATQYARNALFAGELPVDIKRLYPQWWKDDTDDGGKNLFERELLDAQFKKLGADIKFSYHKITRSEQGQKLANHMVNEKNNDLCVVVYNFVDVISHAKTEMEIIKELASNDKAFRSLTASWFKNSPLFEIIKNAQSVGFTLMITTDHGTINVRQPSKIFGDRDTSTNIRYKTGRRLNAEDKSLFSVSNPEDIGLPKINMSSTFTFATEDRYLIYPSRFNHFVSYYKNTYQHGGVSLEEMLIPFAVLSPK
jgi:DNA-binding response OmpR family regulator